VVPFENCVRQRRSVFKMAAMTKNRNFFKGHLKKFLFLVMAAILDTGRR
jgi:hypothetical protein